MCRPCTVPAPIAAPTAYVIELGVLTYVLASRCTPNSLTQITLHKAAIDWDNNIPIPPPQTRDPTAATHPAGEVTSGVPTLAELLQSDGETDQLEAQQAYAGPENARSNVTDAVPSLGALLEEEDTDMSLVGAHQHPRPQQLLEGGTPGATQLLKTGHAGDVMWGGRCACCAHIVARTRGGGHFE